MRILLADFASFIQNAGGSEHVCCEMANEFIQRGHEVSIVYSFGKSGRPQFPLNENVKLYNLMKVHPEKWGNALHASNCIFFGSKLVREVIRPFSKSAAIEWNERCKGKLIKDDIKTLINNIKPDIIISYWIETSYYLIETVKTKIPVITMFHLDPETILATASRGELSSINKSARVQVLMKKNMDVVQRYCPHANVTWIPNAVPQYKQQADLERIKDHHCIINVARLDKGIKQQHLLVQAFSQIAEQYPKWDVEFYGEDADPQKRYQKEMEEWIFEHHLKNRIRFMGQTSDVLSKYLSSDIFAFTSAYEGFGLAMTEAMSAGLPVVAFASCSAVNEIVRDGVDGILCKDGVSEFATGLRILMEDQEKRIAFGANAKKAMEKYAPEKVWDVWDSLISKIVEGNRSQLMVNTKS